MSSAVCATSARVVTPRPAVRARASSERGSVPAPNRRSMLASVPALLLATGARPAAAKAPPEYYDDTMEIIALTKSIISGSDLSEANIANFQAKRDVWYNNLSPREGRRVRLRKHLQRAGEGGLQAQGVRGEGRTLRSRSHGVQQGLPPGDSGPGEGGARRDEGGGAVVIDEDGAAAPDS